LKLISKRLTSIKGVLVHGPAGVGKTIIIQNALKNLNLKVMRVTPSDLLSGSD
jgi:ATP-dependent 26S proteasome regulatory subunit